MSVGLDSSISTVRSRIWFGVKSKVLEQVRAGVNSEVMWKARGMVDFLDAARSHVQEQDWYKFL